MNADHAFSHPASRIAFEVFRLNGALISAGDALVASIGLTSARWQVMGAIAEARGGLSVAGIARNMGLVRQSVQRVVNDLKAEGLVHLVDNPHHRRARLAQLTDAGSSAFDQACARWLTMAHGLVRELDTERIESAIAILAQVRARLTAHSQVGDT
jgi:DNA-binding MarR family transcriptional regulator